MWLMLRFIYHVKDEIFNNVCPFLQVDFIVQSKFKVKKNTLVTSPYSTNIFLAPSPE